MPYIGRELDRGNYLKLDDISSSFDGSTTTFNLTNGGNAFYPGSAFSILVVLAGVVQEPEAAYQINQAQITFASAPLAGDQFFCITLGVALGVNTPANGSVNGAQLAKPFNYDNYFYLDDANNRVGVGTATPMTPLHVEGTGRFTNVTVTGDLTVEGTTSTLDTVVTEVDKLEVGANNSTVGVAITQSGSGYVATFEGGNFGIGNNTPDAPLRVTSSAVSEASQANDIAVFERNDNGYLKVYTPNNKKGGIVFGDPDSPFVGATLYDHTTNKLEFWTGSGPRMYVDSSGNVGIKNTSPNNTLTVGDTVQPSYAPSSAGNYIEIARTSGADAGLLINKDTGQWLVGIDNSDGANAPLKFEYGAAGSAHPGFGAGTLGMIIKHDGKIGIGTDTISDNLEVFAPTNASLQIKGGAAGSDANRSAQLKLLASGSKLYVMEADATDGSFRILDSSTERLRITSTGGATIGSGNDDSSMPEFGSNTGGLTIDDVGGSNTGIRLSHGNDDTYLVQAGNGNFYVAQFGTGSMRFGVGSSGQERLRITSDGKVGIGTVSITHRFHVYGANTIAKFQSSSSYVDLMFQNTGATNGFIQYSNAGNFRFYANSGSTPTLTISSGSPGNVGIGEDSPDVRLHVKEQFDTAYSLTSVTTDSNHLLKLENPSTTANAFSGMQFRVGSGADLYFGAIQQNVNDGDFFFANQNSPQREMMRIKSSGEVGIGTDNPSARLDVVADAASGYIAEFRQAHASNSAQIIIDSPTDGASRPSYMDYATGGTVKWRTGLAYLDANRSFHIGTGSIPANSKLTIKPDGDVGIGTDNPDTKLHVFNSPTTGQFKIGGGNGAGNHRVYINCSETNSYIDSYGNNAYGKLRINAAPLILNDSGGGSVGIGITNPQAKLHVDGTIHQTSIEYPTIRPVLDLNFAATKVLDDRITFRRDSIGTYTDENGLVKYASNNVPRFDHDPTTGESLGLLIEESRTNIAPYGNDMSQYSSSNITKTANDAVAPDGTTTATKIQHGGGGNTWYLDYAPGSPNAAGAGTYTYSVWVKAPDDQPDDYYGCRIAILTTTGNNTETVFSLKKTWSRITITMTYTSETGTIRIHPIIFRNSPGNTDSGKVIPSYVWVWGSQWEQGSFATSYIPTSGSTATRDDDDAFIKGTNFSDIYNETEGTIFSEFSTKVNTGTTSKWIVSLRDPANNNNYISQSTYGSTTVALTVQSGGSGVAYISNANSVVVDQFRKIAASFKVNDFDGADGGTLLTGDTSGAMPTGIARMDIGRGWTDGGQKLEGHIKSIKYYRTKLPDAQLRGLTHQ